MTELIIQTGKHQGKKLELAGKDCLIGRHESCKIRIASGDVSKQHCRLREKDGQLFAKDLGSRNGTFVNEQLLDKEIPLKPGDLLRVGPMSFLVAESKPAPAASAQADAANGSHAQAADDDLIAAWLSEGGDLEKSGQDTTVVIPSAVQNSESQSPPAESPAGSVQPTRTADSTPKSVRDRAKDIICRWQKERGKG